MAESRQQIEAAGYEAVCTPRLDQSLLACGLHDHVRGERLRELRRVPEPSESYALGALTSTLLAHGMHVEFPVDVNERQIDVVGLVPNGESGPVTIRITVEEVS